MSSVLLDVDKGVLLTRVKVWSIFVVQLVYEGIVFLGLEYAFCFDSS